MATIKWSISKKENSEGKAELMIRLTIERNRKPRLRSGIYVRPVIFDSTLGRLKALRQGTPTAEEIGDARVQMTEMEVFLKDLCDRDIKGILTAESLQERINQFNGETPPRPERSERAAREEVKTPSKLVFMPAREPDPEPDEAEEDEKPAIVEPPKRKRGRPKKVVEEAPMQEGGIPTTFFEAYRRFVETRNVSTWRKARYDVMERALYRFEGYRKITRRNKNYKLRLSEFKTEDVYDFEKFLRSEEELYVKYPQLYEKYPCDTRKVRKKAKPKAKGDNTIINLFQCLRSFFNDCMNRRIIDRHPFDDYHGKATERYGTPYYISLEERDIIANHDFSDNPYLEAQRDIFIFHTLIGCRISDLYRLTSRDIVGGAIEYIASKTLKERANTIRVPLNQRGLDLIKKYKGVDPEGRLFPFVLKQRYNDAIKKIFTICGITRMVTIINPATGLEEKRPINELASSHLARRTFVGNLYKKVKDPNIVGALSGHSEGSKAFARYRTIDDDIKRELISYLD